MKSFNNQNPPSYEATQEIETLKKNVNFLREKDKLRDLRDNRNSSIRDLIIKAIIALGIIGGMIYGEDKLVKFINLKSLEKRNLLKNMIEIGKRWCLRSYHYYPDRYYIETWDGSGCSSTDVSSFKEIHYYTTNSMRHWFSEKLVSINSDFIGSGGNISDFLNSLDVKDKDALFKLCNDYFNKLPNKTQEMQDFIERYKDFHLANELFEQNKKFSGVVESSIAGSVILGLVIAGLIIVSICTICNSLKNINECNENINKTRIDIENIGKELNIYH